MESNTRGIQANREAHALVQIVTSRQDSLKASGKKFERSELKADGCSLTYLAKITQILGHKSKVTFSTTQAQALIRSPATTR